MKLIPQEEIDKAAEEYALSMKNIYSEVMSDDAFYKNLDRDFKAGVEFAESEIAKHLTDLFIQNQGLKLFKDRMDEKFPNGIESYLKTYYEVVDYLAFIKEIPEDEHLYEFAENTTDAFELENKGRIEWNGKFVDEVEKFTHKKLCNGN